jgi:hypothetical protein
MVLTFADLSRANIGFRDWTDVPALRHERREMEPTRFTWDGVIIGRVWPKDFTEQDYLLMRVGKRRLKYPDTVTRLGCRIYHLTDQERREAQRVLDRHCLNGFETHSPLRFHNTACNAGRTILLDFLAGSGSHTGITYFAVGTGAGMPAPGDNSLFTEVFRKAITTATVTGNQVDENTFFASNEANYTYTNAGAFGDGATSTLGSGVLFAHAPYSYQKNSSVSISNDYLISFS